MGWNKTLFLFCWWYSTRHRSQAWRLDRGGEGLIKGPATLYCKKKDATEMETINQNRTNCPAVITVTDATLMTTSSENDMETTGQTRSKLLTAKKHLRIGYRNVRTFLQTQNFSIAKRDGKLQIRHPWS